MSLTKLQHAINAQAGWTAAIATTKTLAEISGDDSYDQAIADMENILKFYEKEVAKIAGEEILDILGER